MVVRNFITLICLCMLCTSLQSRIVDVGPDRPIQTIKDGINVVQPGDTLRIFPGIYSEGNILIEKSICILGIDYPVLDGKEQTEILTITADDVSVTGLHIKNVGTSYTEDRAGIRIQQANRFLIQDNLLENTFFGIYLARANNGIISKNRVYGKAVNEMSSGNAIHLWKCSDVEITNNHITKHRDGIYFEFVDNSIISQNISEDHLRYGLHFMFSNKNIYVDNIFRGNGAGVAVMFSKEIEMHNNLFQKNWGSASYGLLLKEITDATISQNRFDQNSIAVYAEGSSRIDFTQNDLVSNGWAFKISGGCVDMIISRNNFIGNTFDVSLNSAFNNNKFTNNYWSSYSGYDLDRDGIGDVPYRPVKLFNYVIQQTPEAVVLLRSLFIDILNFSEKVNPMLTPKNVMDQSPLMSQIQI